MIWDVMPSRRNNPTDEGYIEQGISDLTKDKNATCSQPRRGEGRLADNPADNLTVAMRRIKFYKTVVGLIGQFMMEKGLFMLE